VTTSAVEIPALAAGVWTIDPTHSEVGFSVRHMMVSKVRGTFKSFDGTLTIADNPLDSRVEARIETFSVDTRDENRDNHLRSSDFFEVENYPYMTFVSTGVRPHGRDYVVTGDLTIRGVTRSLDLFLEFNGVSPDPWGGTRAGFSASTEISRADFGISFNIPIDGGGVVVGDRIKISLEIEAVLQSNPAS
jgi:polyisoprenoid-binding protein YceI